MESKKLWQGRFEKDTDRLAEEFVASLPYDSRLYAHDIEASIAHATMLAKARIISEEESGKISEGLRNIYREVKAGKFEFNLADEDIHMAIERSLIDKVGLVGGKLHTARSRNDQVATDMRLYLKEQIKEICFLIKELQEILIDLAKEHKSAIMPGYTHLQRAQPILFSHHLMAYFFMLERDFERLKCCYRRTDSLSLGAGALAGTTFPIDRQFLAEKLGFSKVSENSIDSVSDRDFLVEFLAAAALIMVHLSRFSEELILWSSEEFDFIALDEAYCTGSSIMPQKKNPDVVELVRGKTGRVVGSLTALLTTLKGLPLTYNRDLQEDKASTFEVIDILKPALKVFSALLSTMEAKVENMRKAADESLINATDVADYLAQKGLPFREAHALVGKIVKYCLERKLAFKDLSLNTYKKFSSLFDKEIFEVIKIENSIARHNSLGGTSPEQLRRQFKEAEKNLTKKKNWLASGS